MGNSCNSCIQVVEASTSPDDHGGRRHHMIGHHSGSHGVGIAGSEGGQGTSQGSHANSAMQQPCVDPLIYDLVRRTFPRQNYKGQHQYLYHKLKRGGGQQSSSSSFHHHHHHHPHSSESNVLVGDHQHHHHHDSSSDTNTMHHHHHQQHYAMDYPSPKKTTQTRLILRRRGTTTTSSSSTSTSSTAAHHQETHIYAIRYPKELLSAEQVRDDDSDGGPDMPSLAVEAAPRGTSSAMSSSSSAQGSGGAARPESKPDDPYSPSNMRPPPCRNVKDWVCVSEELDIYVCDTGLSFEDCNSLVATTEQACKGHYAAYTYAKQTLGCREYPILAQACFDPVHRVTHAILDHAKKQWAEASSKSGCSSTEKTSSSPSKSSSTTDTTTSSSSSSNQILLQLDDREPHIVKYDVTKKERQKLDMHTDKSEWTFLIALSDGCGLDYEGGGTFFEALNATVHVQRGHALIFPGKLRHCGQRITKGLRFLLVGFLVDKKQQQQQQQQQQTTSTTTTTTTTTTSNTSGTTTTTTSPTATAVIPPPPRGAAAKAGTTSDYTTVSYAELSKAKTFRVGGGGVTPWSDVAALSDDMISREA